jgi:hypothetical protein
MRTLDDLYTIRGNWRIYSRLWLLSEECASLHTSGLWYVEPANWDLPEPMQRGYDTFAEALMEAQLAEDLEWAARSPRRGYSSWVSVLENAAADRACGSEFIPGA